MDVRRFGHLGQFLAGGMSLADFRAWLSNAWCSDLSEAFDDNEHLADVVEHALWLFDEGLIDEGGVRDLVHRELPAPPSRRQQLA